MILCDKDGHGNVVAKHYILKIILRDKMNDVESWQDNTFLTLLLPLIRVRLKNEFNLVSANFQILSRSISKSEQQHTCKSLYKVFLLFLYI